MLAFLVRWTRSARAEREPKPNCGFVALECFNKSLDTVVTHRYW